jgi:predicted cupin superfamily sugar epimerase
VLGPDHDAGAEPQRVVPARVWQTARSLGAWTLAGCTVAPGFEFAGFELAPEGWEPG